MNDFDNFPLGLNPFERDPGAWSVSLLNHAELVLGCLDAVGARSVLEIGAYDGTLTRLLLLWAERSDASVVAIDPAPQPDLEELLPDHPRLSLVRETSLSALGGLDRLPEAIVLDGDHNYYTVSRELALIEERAGAGDGIFPLLLLHDVCWPHGRRDDYFDPEQIPAAHRQALAPRSKLYPGIPGTHTGGLSYQWPAAREGGPGNGVLTAAEDFAAPRELRLLVIPAFFGLGIIFPAQAPYAQKLAQTLEPWDRNPWLARLERNRVLHLASSQLQLQRATAALERLSRLEAVLTKMLDSRAFAAAESWVRLRERQDPPFSREEIRRLLDG